MIGQNLHVWTHRSLGPEGRPAKRQPSPEGLGFDGG